jgi:hypothetical protein
MTNPTRSWQTRSSRLVLVVLGASLVAVLAATNTAAAQESDSKRLIQASGRLHKLIEKANADGYKLHHHKFSIGGGLLKQGEDAWVTVLKVKLEAGKQYRIVAAGDHRAKDVDLHVLNSKGQVVASDELVDPTAVVDFTPSDSQEFTLRVRVFASENNEACVCLAVVLAK